MKQFISTRQTFSLLILSLCFFTHSFAQDISVIPMPSSLTKKSGVFSLSSATSLSYSDQKDLANVADYLRSRLKPSTGFSLDKKQASSNVIELTINDKADPKLGPEGYSLDVSAEKVIAKANSTAGLFYATQTLLQLLPPSIEGIKINNAKLEIPAVTIVDSPRFGWRGIMLDVSRHFFSKEYVKEFIDQIARFKYNRLHLHLVDDNGWRVEIKSLPKLTQVGAWRVERTGTFGSHDAPKPGEKATYGGFYTHEDIKEIVQYAKDRFIEIIPEIDVPGHSMAALAAYPELSVSKDTSVRVNPGSKFATWYGHGKFEMHIDNTLNPTDEKVYAFLDKVFTEIAMLFPYEYIHMGGDECYKGFWKKTREFRLS